MFKENDRPKTPTANVLRPTTPIQSKKTAPAVVLAKKESSIERQKPLYHYPGSSSIQNL